MIILEEGFSPIENTTLIPRTQHAHQEHHHWDPLRSVNVIFQLEHNGFFCIGLHEFAYLILGNKPANNSIYI